MAEWRNWSGNVRVEASRIETPRDAAQLAILIASAQKVRVVGSGHSYMPLCETNDLLISMSDYEGALKVAADRKSVWAPAGWRLDKLTAALWVDGLSLINQGDIDQQTLAGALATGTHGTGETLGSLATHILGVRLMLADGTIVECGPEQRAELFQAQRLSLGLFGVVTEVHLRVMPACYLEEKIERRRLCEVIESLDELGAATRHMEFFIFPYSNFVVFKTLHPAQPVAEFIESTDMDGDVYQLAFDLGAAVPPMIAPLQRMMMRLLKDTNRRTGPAYRIFPSIRTTRCEEMEYEIPRAQGVATLREVLAHIRKHGMPIQLPLEVRLVAGDDLWMSPFNQGPTMSISFHQYVKMEWRQPFEEVERIFRSHGGRPHWGKRHGLTHTDIQELYPRTPQYLAVRRAVDPGQKFANAHLSALFDLPPPDT